MKYIFILFGIYLLFCTGLGAQDTLHWDYMKIDDISDVYKKRQSFDVFALKNGRFIEVGDTLVCGPPATSTKVTETMIGQGDRQYQSTVYKTITTEWKNVLTPPVPLSEGMDGAQIVVEDIKIFFTKVNGEYLAVDFSLVHFPEKEGIQINVLGMQTAIDNGEVIDPNGPLTKNQALSKLKEAKELLDLELISTQKYDSLKKEMAPFILK